MAPNSPGSTQSSDSESTHWKPSGCYTVGSGKLSETHLSFPLLVLVFSIQAPLLTISPLGDSAPFHASFVPSAICPQDELQEGEPMRDSLEVFGRAHVTLISHHEEEFTSGSACHRGSTIGREAIQPCCVPLTKKRLGKWSSGALHFPNLQSSKR